MRLCPSIGLFLKNKFSEIYGSAAQMAAASGPYIPMPTRRDSRSVAFYDFGAVGGQTAAQTDRRFIPRGTIATKKFK